MISKNKYDRADEKVKGEIENVSKIAKTEGQACSLTEIGFEFVCDFNGHKLFRKRKH